MDPRTDPRMGGGDPTYYDISGGVDGHNLGGGGGRGGGFGRAAQGSGGGGGGGGGPGGGPGGFNALYNRPPSDRMPGSLPGSARGGGQGGGGYGGQGGGGQGGGGGDPAAAARAAALARASAAPFQNMHQPAPAACTNGLERHLIKEGTVLAVSGLLTGGVLPADGYPESVTSVDASSNKLVELPECLFEALPHLAELNISTNALRELPIDLCECMGLRSIRAAHNRIGELSFAAQRPLASLTELNVDRNSLGEVPAYLWACPSLKTVSLCANKLTLAALRMPGTDGGVRGGSMAPLEHLDLGENRLGALPPLGLFPRLREVHVQQNGLRELPVPQLVPLQQLQTLDISMNDVSQLPPELAMLPVLQNLTIIGNPIRSIPQSVQQRGATAVLDLLKKRLPG